MGSGGSGLYSGTHGSNAVPGSAYYMKPDDRLLSCETGGVSRGFALGLADRLNVVVEAPSKLVWVRPDGSYFVAGRSKSDFNLPDMSNRGRLIKFYPRGAKK